MVVPPTPSSSSAKGLLRRTLRAARAAYVASLVPGDRARLEAALAAILDANVGPGIVASYSAYGDEIDPGGAGRDWLYPRATPGAPLSFHRGTGGFVRGALGMREPAAGSPAVIPDIILVPLIAVDADGNRLGQGGGHYDRTLALLRASRTVIAVGVAWDAQRVDALPADPWDAPLDALATPSGWHRFVR